MIEYYGFNMIPNASNGNENITTILPAGSLTLLCTLHFDTDAVSDTYNHWICVLDVISDVIDVPDRSFVLNPNTMFFDGDELYSVVIKSDLDKIGINDLEQVTIIIGVPSNE